MVVLNKIDLPHVAAQQAELEEKLKAVIPHTRFMAVSAMQKTNTGELMHRVCLGWLVGYLVDLVSVVGCIGLLIHSYMRVGAQQVWKMMRVMKIEEEDLLQVRAWGWSVGRGRASARTCPR